MNIMSINIEVRKRQLQSLDQYINSSKKRLQALIRQLGWNAKQILEVITSNYYKSVKDNVLIFRNQIT